MVETFYSCDGRVHPCVEQPELLALLKLIRTQFKPGGPHRRKANGNWSAEEDFSWAWGHCFFEHRKKFTIKDHLIRQVCQKSIASKKSRGQAGRAKLKRHLSCDSAREKDESIRGKTPFPCNPPGRQIFVLDM